MAVGVWPLRQNGQGHCAVQHLPSFRDQRLEEYVTTAVGFEPLALDGRGNLAARRNRLHRLCARWGCCKWQSALGFLAETSVQHITISSLLADGPSIVGHGDGDACFGRYGHPC